MNSPAEKVQVARINRKLIKYDEKLFTSRRYGQVFEMGRFYVLDIPGNFLVDSGITDLDEFEKELTATYI